MAVGVDGGNYFQRCGVGGGRVGEAPTRWIIELQRLYYHYLKSGSNSSILAWAPDPDLTLS